MKLRQLSLSLFTLSLLSLSLSSCGKQGSYWNRSSALKYDRNGKPLWEDEGNPRMVERDEDFKGPSSEEFIALQDADLHRSFIDGATMQPRYTPGEAGSHLPSLCDYSVPAANSVFKTIHFETDEHTINGEQNIAILKKIAQHLKNNPKIYLYVEGHCDQRGTESYNQALGTKRANAVREFLIRNGVDAEHVHTVSYGKEKPVVRNLDDQSLRKNRRSEFKIYKVN